MKPLNKIFLISITWFITVLLLSSCTTKTQEYQTDIVTQVPGNFSVSVKKDIINVNRETPIKVGSEKITKDINNKQLREEIEIKKDIWDTSVKVDESNNIVTTVNLQDFKSIKKFEEEIFDYETFKEWLDSTIISQNIIKLLRKLKISSYPNGIDIKEVDKLFFEKINPSIYNTLKNLRTILIDKNLIDTNNVISKVIKEEGFDKDMKKITVKRIEYYYQVNYNWMLLSINKEKVDKYLTDSFVKQLYISRVDTNMILPVSSLGLSWYFINQLITLLEKDKKLGILQYFGSLNTLLPINWITSDYILIKHWKILQPYIDYIIRQF